MRGWVVLMILLAGVAWAEPVYVKGQELPGPVSGSGDQLYVSLEELATRLGLKVHVVNGGWYVTRRQVDPAALKVEPETVVIDDVAVESRDEDGQRLVNLKQFVEILGGEIIRERDRLVVGPPTPGRNTRRVQPGDVKAILKGPREATELPGPSPAAEALVRVNQPGQKVVLTQVLVKGKTNFVYFYTPWSAACKSLTPGLEAFARANPDYAVLAVDIARKGSPVSKQYKVNAVPAFLVYDANGRLKARGEVARKWVMKLVPRP